MGKIKDKCHVFVITKTTSYVKIDDGYYTFNDAIAYVGDVEVIIVMPDHVDSATHWDTYSWNTVVDACKRYIKYLDVLRAKLTSDGLHKNSIKKIFNKRYVIMNTTINDIAKKHL